jgi:two-component system chemotaxis response regulator CheB
MSPCRVLIVDDSRIFRSVLAEACAELPHVEVVGSVFSGEKALEFVQQQPVDVVTLDVEMPGLCGLETLRQLRSVHGDAVGVLMVSSQTCCGAKTTLAALELGAFDFITKPTGGDAAANLTQLRTQLQAKLCLWQNRRSRTPTVTAPPRPVVRTQAVQALVIGVSTGGPAVLPELLPAICRATEVPIFLVQHIVPEFTPVLVESLGRKCAYAVRLGRDGLGVQPRTLYVAPGDRHLMLRRCNGSLCLGVNDQPKENNCRPAADVLFRSAAAALGGGVLGVVLTGMGIDGTAGAGAIKRAGGTVLVQDEASSIVWGMPGSVVAAGWADAIVPLARLADAVVEIARR